jgi:protein-S-isoprenylcysteine O-methyltransferase Ste14
MIAKLLLQNSAFVLAMGAVLFGSAGTLHWPGAWAFLVTSAVLGPACGLWLAWSDPALLAERLRLTARSEQPAADSTAFIMWVFRENSFAAPVVKVQAERGHHVIDTGPYAWVRHPMYSGVSLFFVGAPLLIGAWWGVAMAPLFFVLFAIRVRIEERTLMAGLSGYADYVSRVRYRLVPGIW